MTHVSRRNATQRCLTRSTMWQNIVRHLLLHVGVILGACSGLCWAGCVRAWYEPGGAAVRRAGGRDAALALRVAQLALPATATALALAAHLATAAAAATASEYNRAHSDTERVERNPSMHRTILLVLVVLVCSALVTAALAGALWAQAAARRCGGAGGGGVSIPSAAAAAADLLDVLRLLLRVCAKHHLLPDDIDLIVEETIEEFYVWIDALCAISGLTLTLLVLAVSAAVALLCAQTAHAGRVVPTAAHIPSDIQYEEKLLWDKKNCLCLEETRG